MKTAFISMLCTGLLLGAGLAFAKEPKAPPSPPEPARQEVPQTCEEQCKLLETGCMNPCKQIKSGNQLGKAACTSDCRQVATACNGSCRELGRMDGQYIMEHIRPPKVPAGSQQQGDDE